MSRHRHTTNGTNYGTPRLQPLQTSLYCPDPLHPTTPPGIGPVCWQSSCPAGTTDCGSYCAPTAAGSCANFVGATWQNCKAKYGLRRALQEFKDAVDHHALLMRDPASLDCDANPLDCYCLDRDPGVYPNPHGPASSYVICALRVAHVRQCPAGHVYDDTVKNCDLERPMGRGQRGAGAKAAEGAVRAAHAEPSCEGRTEGRIYFMESRGPTTAFTCVNGQAVPRRCASDHMVWDEATAECVVPVAKPQHHQQQRDGADQQLPGVCTTAACFCKGKADGKYADVLGMDMYRYIECRAGAGRVRRCPVLHMWDNRLRACSHAPRNGTALVAGCRDVDCFCVGRPDGVYDSPLDGSKGIRCNLQYPHVIECPEGYEFGAGRQPFCQEPEGEGEVHEAEEGGQVWGDGRGGGGIGGGDGAGEGEQEVEERARW